MAKLLNFYENLKEAQSRLLRTVVAYEGVPHHVLGITNHKPDGIFRVYLLPLDQDGSTPIPDIGHIPQDHNSVGTFLDTWMATNPSSLMLRKHMNSPKFDRFRPFPLGMCNYQGRCFYLQRQPQRHREQGLTASMVDETQVTAVANHNAPNSNAGGMRFVPLFSDAVRACVLAEHPSPEECLTNLKNPQVENEAAAFHRNFALVRGPIGMMFVAYKQDVIGVLPYGDFTKMRIGRHFHHTKEAVEELGLFGDIKLLS